jgi:hypothetical protein
MGVEQASGTRCPSASGLVRGDRNNQLIDLASRGLFVSVDGPRLMNVVETIDRRFARENHAAILSDEKRTPKGPSHVEDIARAA